MKKYVALLLVILVALLGCTPPPALTVTLQSPANGSSVSSLTPILAWSCTQPDATYQLEMAPDSNFQDLIIDKTSISGPSYSVPSDKLTDGKTYYWRVSANKGGQTSGWTPYWCFQTPSPSPTPPTPSTGTIVVNITLDGSQWSGAINYTITGPKTNSGSSAPQTFSNLPPGDYTVGYSSGGPKEATLTNLTPSATQALTAGGSITFNLNFHSQAPGSIKVKATLDGSSWSGKVSYSLQGQKELSGSSAPNTFSNLPSGDYTVHYYSHGPTGATLGSISPSPTQHLSSDGSLTFTLNFHSQASSTIRVRATVDGSSWSGKVQYTIHGPYNDSGSYVSDSFDNLPAGTYTVSYRSGGPFGATLASISPSPTQTVYPNDRITFTLNFYSSQASSTVKVKATLDGKPWETDFGSGSIEYGIHGPHGEDRSTTMPDTFRNMPAGDYSLNYRSGGPTGATLGPISPSPNQNVSPGDTITFTLQFYSQANGTVKVNATLDNKPWEIAIGSGAIDYGIHGPHGEDRSSNMPDTFRNLPAGDYTLNYHSGGPIGATLGRISPSPRQTLSPGGTITFTLHFHSQANGTIEVNATLDGEPWSGDVSYTVHGPYTDSSSSAPDSFSGCPEGEYTIIYNSGGPHQSKLVKITPHKGNLEPGGSLTFTLHFEFQGGLL